MNEFDFLSRVPLGQYIATDSILHRLDPRTKIFIFGLLVLVITFTPSRIGLGVAILILIAAILVSRVNLGYALKGLLPPLPFLLFIAIIQILFYSPSVGTQALFTIGKLQITMAGVWVGILLLVRFAALILCISLATFCISTSELIQGLANLLKPFARIGIPIMDVIMVIQITIRFLPFLAQTAERIAKAQASRGADWGTRQRGLVQRAKQVIPMIIPLFLISLRRAENLALAMDARAYGAFKLRTSMTVMRYQWSDLIAVIIIIMVSLSIVLL